MSEQANDLTMDPELLAGFLDETRDQLADVQAQLVAIESVADRAPVIQAIFRAAHSIKGNSSFFGFLRAKTLAHTLENLLDALRSGRLAVDAEIVSTLLIGFDALGGMFQRVRSGGAEVDDQPALEALQARITAQVERAPGAAATIDWNGIRTQLSAAEATLAALPEAQRQTLQPLLAHLRRLDPGKPAAGKPAAAAGDPIATLSTLLEAPFEGILPSERSEEILHLLEAIQGLANDEPAKDLARDMLDGYRTFTEAMGFDPVLRDYLRERLQRIPDMPGFASAAATSAPAAAKAAEPAPAARPPAAESMAKSMRVSEAKIDTFLRYVGELLVVGDMFDHLHTRAAAQATSTGRTADAKAPQRLARDLKRASETFAELSGKLQAAIMGIRKVPIRPLLQKVPRLVRDAALAKGKDCQVIIEGEAVEIDKSLVDLLDAPLTHMTRNAADHGIEPPEARLAAGKPRTGTVTVRATETTSSIMVVIDDDGGGLDLERIRAKAEAMGLLRPGAALSEEAITGCIFAPGLSTAEQVTDISGRGVGMDVVKRSIEQAGGVIQITTRKGLGTRFQITLPKRVTTQILPGYLFRLHDQLFVVPLDRVRETFRVLDADVTTIAGCGRCILRRGEVLPLVSLADVLGMPELPPSRRATAIAIEAGHRRMAIEVDQVVGVQKVVIREITGLPVDNDLLAGGALMGDGSVALILDAEALVGHGAKG